MSQELDTRELSARARNMPFKRGTVKKAIREFEHTAILQVRVQIDGSGARLRGPKVSYRAFTYMMLGCYLQGRTTRHLQERPGRLEEADWSLIG